MKKYFYIGLFGILIFEILNVYFIMPMPGSQEINSLGLAYFLYDHRWIFRIVFGILMLAGIKAVFEKRKWIPILLILITGFVTYVFNFVMTADHMFHQPQHLVFKNVSENKVNPRSLIIGVELNGIAKAYPIQFLEFHHQVQDTIAGKPIMVTYCDVCRSGIVFEPYVDGRVEKFRLVGMDHFNAMFEDESTKSWWRQSTGECVTGPLKGSQLSDFPSQQMTITKWTELHPNTLIMQADETYKQEFDTTLRFDYGLRRGGLTGTDSLSWKNKSWIVGVEIGGKEIAYDWNELKKKRIVNDSAGKQRFVIAISTDEQSFCAFLRPNSSVFTISHDTLFSEGRTFDFSGVDLGNRDKRLNAIPAKQEFWHSWLFFHPESIKK